MVTLYGSELSLYSGKARSYLRKQGIKFQQVKSTIGVYKKIIIPNTGVRFIPVVKTEDGEYLQDTTVIIDQLEETTDAPSVYPETPAQKLAALMLEVYGDEWLLIPAMHYRWNFPEQNSQFIYAEFGSVIAPKGPKFLQRFFGKKLSAKFRGFVPGLGISDASIPAIEKSYEALLADLNTHFSHHSFLFGERPCIADFGFIGPLYAHLYRDPAPGELMRRIAPQVAKWVERMISDERFSGELVANDEIPETLLPVLRRMAIEQLPVLSETQTLLDDWHAENPNEVQVPRFIGEHEVTIGAAKVPRKVLPHSLWMWQRAVDFYQSIVETTEMGTWLNQSGFSQPLKNASTRLTRINNVMSVEQN